MNKEERATLRRAVERARRLLEEEVADQLEGTFGILQSGRVLDNAPGDPSVRQRLLELITHHQAGGESPKGAAERATREIAFTTLNRFVALKMAERRGLMRECISKGPLSDGIRELADCAPGLRAALPDGGYRLLLEAVMDEISLGLSVLFDRRASAGLIWPRPKALDELLHILNAAELAGLWEQDETIGWVYQYFNCKEERDEMRKASRSPRDTRELAVRNQFFTPRYVVEFLTDNTLGRIWYEMRKNDTALEESCRYLVRRPSEVFLAPGESAPPSKDGEADLTQEELLRRPVYIEHRPKKDPRDIKVLDPACGSGHFLLYAFDLLERIYEEAWADPESPASEATGGTLREDHESLDELRRAAPKLIIEHNLHGIDIDPRTVQIAALALWLRAQRSWQDLSLRPTKRPQIARSNIVTAEPMPGEEDMRHEFTGSLKPRVLGQLVNVVFERMKLAGEAGSLLKIEEEIKESIAAARKQWVASSEERQLLLAGIGTAGPKQRELRFDLADVNNERFWEEAENRILEALKTYAERVENGRAFQRRLFAEDAARGLAFIDLCHKRYDVILMNPPFGASSRSSKVYIDERYPDSKGDLLANFIERDLQLADINGRIGAISSRTLFFLGSFEKFRTEVFGKTGHVRLLADLGEGVLDATVETAVYALSRHRRGEPESLFFRLLVDAEKAEALQHLTSECLEARLSQKTFVISPRNFKALSGRPYAYWISTSTIRALSEHPRIEGSKAAIRVGLQTGEDFRHLRLLWEIPNQNVVPHFPVRGNEGRTIKRQSLSQLRRGSNWVPFSKTDFASPWFSPITLVVNWKRDGNEIKNFVDSKGKLRSRPQNEAFYFRPGFSYMGRCTRLVPYLVPAGVIPTARRAQVFPKSGQEYSVLAICGSNVGSAVARFRGEKFAWPNFQASMVQGLPACEFPEQTLTPIKEHVDTEVNRRRAVVQRYEPFQEFALPAWFEWSDVGDTAWDLCSLFERGVENKIAEAFGLSSTQLVELERDIREAASIRQTSEDRMSQGVEEGSDEGEAELTVELISETPKEKAVGLLQYAVGGALGRWDIRFALKPSLVPKLPEPFDPLPVCPPGMLVGPDGLPAEADRIASEEWLRVRPDAGSLPPAGAVLHSAISDSAYPLRISWDGILVDEPGVGGSLPHRDDILRRVRDALEVIWEDKAREIEQEVCRVLGVRDLRDYLRRPLGFFGDHLKRYSKSRRKAPIYWPLSTASGAYTIWVYYHRLTEDTLYRVVSDYVSPKISQVEDRVAQREAEHKTSQGRDAARLAKELGDLSSFLEELKELRDELLRVARLPYRPNLNDGVQITAAPLWRLFRLPRWRSELERTWQALERGDYDWAHLAYAIWPERVREVCRRDRSIAIAHGLEELYEGSSAPPRAARRRQVRAG